MLSAPRVNMPYVLWKTFVQFGHIEEKILSPCPKARQIRARLNGICITLDIYKKIYFWCPEFYSFLDIQVYFFFICPIYLAFKLFGFLKDSILDNEAKFFHICPKHETFSYCVETFTFFQNVVCVKCRASRLPCCELSKAFCVFR